jgi:hypothetical protein
MRLWPWCLNLRRVSERGVISHLRVLCSIVRSESGGAREPGTCLTSRAHIDVGREDADGPADQDIELYMQSEKSPASRLELLEWQKRAEEVSGTTSGCRSKSGEGGEDCWTRVRRHNARHASMRRDWLRHIVGPLPRAPTLSPRR